MIKEAGRPLTLGFCGKIAATALQQEVVLDASGQKASVANSGVGDHLGVKTFEVLQSHIPKHKKKNKQLVQMAVGTMAVQFYALGNPGAAPLSSILYTQLKGGDSPGTVLLCLQPGTVLLCLQPP